MFDEETEHLLKQANPANISAWVCEQIKENNRSQRDECNLYLSSNNSSYVLSPPYFNQFRRIRRSILVCSNLYACKIIEYHTESYVRMLSHYLQIVKDRAIALDRHVYLLLRVCWSFPVCEWMYVIGNGLHSNGSVYDCTCH